MRKERLFEKIGEMTILFATLEHQLQTLLEILLGEKSRLIGPFFIHELNLAVLLRKIKHIARYKMQGNGSDLEELEHLLKQIEATRDIRNLLVHGNWQIDEECTACPVRVRDFKIKFEDGQWQELTETTFNEKKLTHLVRRLQGMINQAQYITRRLLGPQAASGSAPRAL
ncbi:MAG: hypothetical protein A2Y76_03635 [Planctomycetes bacterium RBG_13_60_9]|nr:MAG: hypothetical protein A2Y76_03635 [Planctomycetes bacterium RBG_13_60_9]